MKRVILPLVLGMLFLTLQTTLLPSLPIQRIRPDLVLILVLYWGLSYSPISGGILSLFMGYLMDLFSGNSFGLYTFSRPLLFFLAQHFRNRFYLESVLAQFLFVFLFALFEGLFLLVLLSALNPAPLAHLYDSLLTFCISQCFLTGLISPVLFLILNRITPSLFHQHGMEVRERG